MKYQSITQRKQERAKLLKRLELWFTLLKVIVIATILFCLMSCAAQPAARIKNDCRKHVVTYGDAIECMIQLDEAQQ